MPVARHHAKRTWRPYIPRRVWWPAPWQLRRCGRRGRHRDATHLPHVRCCNLPSYNRQAQTRKRGIWEWRAWRRPESSKQVPQAGGATALCGTFVPLPCLDKRRGEVWHIGGRSPSAEGQDGDDPRACLQASTTDKD